MAEGGCPPALRPSPFSLFCRFYGFPVGRGSCSHSVGNVVPNRSGMLFPTGRDFCSQGLGILFPAGRECWKSKFEYPEIIPVSKVYTAWTINPWYKKLRTYVSLTRTMTLRETFCSPASTSSAISPTGDIPDFTCSIGLDFTHALIGRVSSIASADWDDCRYSF